MKLLEERIRKDGTVKAGNVLKVDSFLNHQMDVKLFQEMGKAALVGFFLNGAYLLGNVKVGPVCRLAVLADIIGQSVVQLSDTDIFVDRDRRHLLCKYLLKIAAKN